MPALVIRGVEEGVVFALKVQALRNKRSPSQEAIAILKAALREGVVSSHPTGRKGAR